MRTKPLTLAMTALCAALGAPAPATAHHVDGHVPDRNVVITPDRTSLTVEAQNYIKAYDAFEDLIWRRSVGTDYEDMAVAKSGLLGRLFAPASSILPFTGAATHTYEVCNPAIRAGCWLFQRTDSDVATYPYSVQRHEAWMSNWPSAAGLWGGYHYPPLARYRALDFWYLSPTNVAHTDCHPAYREAGADWRVLRSTETGAAACRLGVTEYRAMAFLDASPDLARPQADDPAVPNTPWSAYPYSSGWPRSYVTYLKTQDPAVVDRIVQYMAFRIRPDLVESPYPALPR